MKRGKLDKIKGHRLVRTMFFVLVHFVVISSWLTGFGQPMVSVFEVVQSGFNQGGTVSNIAELLEIHKLTITSDGISEDDEKIIAHMVISANTPKEYTTNCIATITNDDIPVLEVLHTSGIASQLIFDFVFAFYSDDSDENAVLVINDNKLNIRRLT